LNQRRPHRSPFFVQIVISDSAAALYRKQRQTGYIKGRARQMPQRLCRLFPGLDLSVNTPIQQSAISFTIPASAWMIAPDEATRCTDSSLLPDQWEIQAIGGTPWSMLQGCGIAPQALTRIHGA
jgi:hypothetical protein